MSINLAVFGAMLFTINLLMKTDSTVICVVYLSLFFMSHFLQKIADLEDTLC